MHEQYDTYILTQCLDDEAKRYWAVSWFLGMGVFVCGILGIFISGLASPLAYIATLLTLTGFVCDQRFDASRGKAQELRRKLDLRDSFGWGIEKDDFNDLLVRCSKSVKMRAKGVTPDSPYFESKEQVGPKRALQNVRESAWWSEHLAEKMHKYMLTSSAIVAVVAVISLIALLSSVESHIITNASIYTKLARAVTSFLMLMFSLSLIKLTISYAKFSKSAASCKEAANAQLKKSSTNQDLALIRMYEYFIVRNGSPVLPTWLWRWHKDELNDLYPYKSDNVLIQE